MISKEKLIEYARLKGYNLGQAEKDYFQEIILFILYSEFGKELVFKGGTALTKCYGFDRFSEDLDFTAAVKKDFNTIISNGLKNYFLEFTAKEKETDGSNNLIYRINGPLYVGQENSTCKISLDISIREKAKLPALIKRIGLHIEEIPSFDVSVMDEKEILAEKVRAIITRNKARDLYDIYYLLKKGIKKDYKIIEDKLNFYSVKFDKALFKKSVILKKVIWSSELKHLVKSVPDFNEVKDYVIKAFN
ncbi:MAG: nucleotidyl transferase AbiEii/AbiGii toxin family protein [Nanoarchaeota archaeon]|nr:nucleotidyl transferase AbiEii/AbiGii toxin family protein [Nanoarchaeota archaeon]MBU1005182.1 nucleotidyl transferase AbiEii/AbiGii toxin family protein [Nanoarchaeota archaeon]MBU1946800.1 nucleotidyl transferase AbiEii/AbiGii toxin family protein [Nanoarchaeota archaeon]